jgi:Xaa-Pro aminopeptidase
VYPHQRERLTAALAAHHADVLVGTTPANVAYLTGFRSASRPVSPETSALAVTAPAGTALVLPAIDTPTLAESDASADHVVPYGPFVFAYASAPGDVGLRVREWTQRRAASPGAGLVAALEALGIRGGTVALDEAGLTAATARDVAAALTGFTIADGSAALLEARAVKGPWEIEALDRALGVAEEALNALVQVLKPGTTEREAVALFEAEVRRRGGVPCSPLITFGRRTALPASPPSDRALRGGELVRLDVGCVRQGYHAGVTRTAVAGEPDARQEAVYDAVSGGLDAGIAAVRPGATAGDVFATVVRAVREGGLPQFDRHHVGCGIGLDARETPVLGAGGRTPLEAGMVLRLETPYYELGWSGAQVTDTVLVTQAGARVMNRTRRGLLVLD